MQKIRYLLIALSLFFFVFASSTFAKVIAEEKGAVEIGSEEIVDDDLFLGGETIQIDGVVNGDVYAAAESIRVNGTINGDLHAAAGTIYLNGTISQDVYAGGGNININGSTIGDSLLVGAGSVNIDNESTIVGSIIAGAGNIAVYSKVGRNIMIGAGSLDLNSDVAGEVRVGGGDMTIGPDTKIAKDLYYAVGDENEDAKISQTASIAGTIQRYDHNLANRHDYNRARESTKNVFAAFNFFTLVISLLGALVVGALWLRFFPRTIETASNSLYSLPLASLGWGLLVSILTIPALFILAITIIGIPLAALLLLLFLLAFYLSKIVVGFALGKWIFNKFEYKSKSPYFILFVGLLVIYLLKLVPIVNIFVGILITIAGIGAITLSLKHSQPRKSR